MTTHYTMTGPYAGQTYCGAPRSTVDRFIHPRIDYTPDDVCPECQRLWDGAVEIEDMEADCPACGYWNAPMGTLGTMHRYYCRDCGMEYARGA